MRWGHVVYGSEHQAWCHECDVLLTTWRTWWGDERLPTAARRTVAAHRSLHPL